MLSSSLYVQKHTHSSRREEYSYQRYCVNVYSVQNVSVCAKWLVVISCDDCTFVPTLQNFEQNNIPERY